MTFLRVVPVRRARPSGGHPSVTAEGISTRQRLFGNEKMPPRRRQRPAAGPRGGGRADGILFAGQSLRQEWRKVRGLPPWRRPAETHGHEEHLVRHGGCG